ncbi:MAG TPA: amylo-alpha-1,6-glucosidase, partial [Noviherbaspirillum sp.]
QRGRRGQDLPPEIRGNRLVLGYRGLDKVVYRTHILCEPSPQQLSADKAEFGLHLPSKSESRFFVTVVSEREGKPAPAICDYASAFHRSEQAAVSRAQSRCRIVTSNPLLNSWIARSTADLAMLSTTLPQGDYPYAGLPWYAATFGRDGIITARECLWLDPGMAKGVLAYLAATQADAYDAARDAEPGKILHEMRAGEMAATGEIPFHRYYGTVDATPLFVGLAGAYYERTGDLEFIRGIWNSITKALHWIDQDGDRDGDGFVEYERQAGKGLEQQGWKDSFDAIFHRDGRLAEPPIALCEVQGYVYDARLQAARLAQAVGEPELARDLQESARTLKKNFNEAFWCEEIGSYALALDGGKRQCAVAASNAGHALWTGIAEQALAARVAQRLLREDLFCGWGVRTVGDKEVRYNPMSYHNGSVWPHDNALIAAGMARYGFTDGTLNIFKGLLEAVDFMELHRLPELFCGFARHAGEGPMLYPLACAPQAWASAAVFCLLQACLDPRIDPAARRIQFGNPQLPPFLDAIEIVNLKVGDAAVDLRLQRRAENIDVELLRKHGEVDVVAG